MKRMTSRILLSAVGLAILAACGGSKSQEVLDNTSSTSSSSSGGASGAPSSSGASGTSNGGVDGSSGGGGTCTQEREPNDNKDTANPLAPSVCGVLEQNSDVDFLTFQLHQGTRSVSINFSGDVTLTVEVEGAQTVTLGGGSTQTVPFVMGKPYFVEVRAATHAAKTDWRVDLVEK